MENPTERLEALASAPDAPDWLRELIPELLEKDPVDVAAALRKLYTLFQLRSDWIRFDLGWERPSAANSNHFVDAMLIASNPGGTKGVAVWQGRVGNGAPEADIHGDPIVEGAWYVVSEGIGTSHVVSGPIYPLGLAAEAAAGFLRRRRSGLFDEEELLDPETPQPTEVGRVS